MEAYIIIISAAITAIAIAYKIASNLKNTTTTFKTFPMVVKDGNYVLSFPVGIPNDSTIDPVDSVKVYLNVKNINENDFESFKIISNVVDWVQILQGVMQGVEQTSYTSNASLINVVLIECRIELPTPIMADIEFDTNSKINITRHDTI